MAFDYITNPTGVFFRGGKVIKYVNSHLTNATTTLPAELKAIADPFETADMTDQIAGLYAVYTGMEQQEAGNRQRLAALWDNILADRTSVLNQLSVTSAGLGDVLPALVRQMITDVASVQKITTTVGAVAAAAGNTGNGTVLLTKKLDGATQPMLGAVSLPQYAGLDSELATNETMTFDCVQDSGRDGLTEGAESFSWLGKIADQTFGYLGDGSGRGPRMTVGNGTALETDGELENWGGTGNNTPTSWTAIGSTVFGTHVFRESTTIYRGTYSAKIVNSGAVATIGIQQSMTNAGLRGKKIYCVSVRMRSSAVPAAGTFEVKFSGTGYTPGAGESISVLAASFPGAVWTLYNFFAVMPSTPPSDLALLVQVSATLSAGTNVFVDTIHINEVQYHGGIGAVVVAGSTPFVVGDRFTSAISESAETVGVFNRFFRRKYKTQLPSSAGAPTIVDALAT